VHKPICDEWKDIRKIFQENLVSYTKGYQTESPKEVQCQYTKLAHSHSIFWAWDPWAGFEK